MTARGAALTALFANGERRGVLAVKAVVTSAAVLAGCSTPAPMPTAAPQLESSRPAAPAATRPAIDTRFAPTAAVSAFEVQQRQAAQNAATLGRWSDAADAWDVLLALHPNDASLQTLYAQALANARGEATERVKKARVAQQRGDTDTAWRLYLEALALQPGLEPAVAALRGLDRERSGRRLSFAPAALQVPAQTAAGTPGATGQQPAVRATAAGPLAPDKGAANGRAAGAPAKLPAGSVAAVSATGSAAVFSVPSGTASRAHNDIEHASLLARQGEIDSAITLLLPHAQAHDDNLAARRLLADLYFRQAEKLPAGQGPAVLTALRQSLLFDPTHLRAQQRLNQLQNGLPAAPLR